MMRKNESGQALVLVLLSLAVVLTIILFILSRSITDVSVSSGQAESVRAFSAAEAGIEKALVVGAGSSSSIGDATYTANVTDYAAGTSNFSYPAPLISGDTMTTWFVAHDSESNIVCSASSPCFTGNTIKVCWGNSGTSADSATTPAVEVSVYYETVPGTLSTARIARLTLDPSAARRSVNSFAAPDGGTCTIGDTSFVFQKTFNFSDLGIPSASYGSENGLLFARVKFLYNTDIAHLIGTSVDFSGNSTLPSQGIDVVSTGTAGQSNRKLSVFQGWPEFPFVGNVIFSPGSIVK